MKKSKVIMFVLISTLMVGIVGYTIAHPTEISYFEGASHSGCHGTSGTASTGSLSVSTSVSGRVITITASVQGFTEAITPPRGGTVSLGLPYGRGDNPEFGYGIIENTVGTTTGKWFAVTDIELDNVTGDSPKSYKFKVLAPTADGTYDLILTAINGVNTTGDEVNIIYLDKTLVVAVTGDTIAVVSLAVVGNNNLFVTIGLGLLGVGIIAILFFHKRK
ncbi:MAG: hypothetical protein ACFFFT_13135 [Candidatus Thorarchaeota archaeon]